MCRLNATQLRLNTLTRANALWDYLSRRDAANCVFVINEAIIQLLFSFGYDIGILVLCVHISLYCREETTLGIGLITGTINCEFCDLGQDRNI